MFYAYAPEDNVCEIHDLIVSFFLHALLKLNHMLGCCIYLTNGVRYFIEEAT